MPSRARAMRPAAASAASRALLPLSALWLLLPGAAAECGPGRCWQCDSAGCSAEPGCYDTSPSYYHPEYCVSCSDGGGCDDGSQVAADAIIMGAFGGFFACCACGFFFALDCMEGLTNAWTPEKLRSAESDEVNKVLAMVKKTWVTREEFRHEYGGDNQHVQYYEHDCFWCELEFVATRRGYGNTYKVCGTQCVTNTFYAGHGPGSKVEVVYLIDDERAFTFADASAQGIAVAGGCGPGPVARCFFQCIISVFVVAGLSIGVYAWHLSGSFLGPIIAFTLVVPCAVMRVRAELRRSSSPRKPRVLDLSTNFTSTPCDPGECPTPVPVAIGTTIAEP